MKKAAFVLFALATAAVYAAGPFTKPDPVKAHFIPAENAKAGQTIETKLEVNIDKEWHLFSEKPEVAGVKATTLQLDPSEAYSVEKVVFPTPTQVYSDVFEKQMNFYQGTVQIAVTLKMSASAIGDVPVKGTLQFQSCSDKLCLPPAKLAFSGTQTVAK